MLGNQGGQIAIIQQHAFLPDPAGKDSIEKVYRISQIINRGKQYLINFGDGLNLELRPRHDTHGALCPLEKPIKIEAGTRGIAAARDRIRKSLDAGGSHAEYLTGGPHDLHGLKRLAVIIVGIGRHFPFEVIRDDGTLGKRRQGHNDSEPLLAQFLGEVSPGDAGLNAYKPVIRVNFQDLVHPAHVQHDAPLPGYGGPVAMNL